jgi:hypothetical protein
MLTEILHRLQRRASLHAAPHRTEIIPPALLQGAGALVPGWRAVLREWFSTGWHVTSRDPSAAPVRAGSERLQSIRNEFLESLHDIRTQQAGMLQERIRIARSLRELWHLRPEVFRLVALRFSQAEAQLRLDRLNRHFPTRAPRSGFAPLDSAAPAPDSRSLPGRR